MAHQARHTHHPPLQVCKYIDMPLQHINNMVLLAMNRPPQDHTTALLAKLRERIPGLALRTTFISGAALARGGTGRPPGGGKRPASCCSRPRASLGFCVS